MLRFLKEPFIQFLLIGALVYCLYALLNTNQAPATTDGSIVITPQIEEAIAAQTKHQLAEAGEPVDESSESFRQWVAANENAYIRNEIFYREGLARGLDLNDPVIKERVIAKLEVLAAENASAEELPEQALEQYYIDHLEEFSWGAQLDIWQLFYSKDKRPDTYQTDCLATNEQINQQASIDLNALAESSDQDPAYRRDARFLEQPDLIVLFGEQGATQIMQKSEPGWVEPIFSEKGCHIVKVLQKRPGGRHSFEQARAHIAETLEVRRNQEAVDNFYRQIKAGYEVVRP